VYLFDDEFADVEDSDGDGKIDGELDGARNPCRARDRRTTYS
jgi:hypothetical protein